MLDENRFLIENLETLNSGILFEKRVCVKFIRDGKTNLCLGCRREQSKHELPENDDSNSQSQIKWDYLNCTVKKPTDAYGKLIFPGSHFKSAKYIRVEIETDVTNMIQLLYHPKGWNLQPPKLIISVTGGAQKFTLPAATRKAFKRGLAKAAASTGSWIITGGTEYGVMRLVGEAVAEETSKYGRDMVVLGIATWGKIALRDRMILGPKRISVDSSSIIAVEDPFANLNLNHMDTIKIQTVMYSKDKYQKTDDSVFLCSNHNHFILVDDGSESEFGKEIEFRARLENELRKGRSLKYYEKQSTRTFVRMKSGTQSTVSSDFNVNETSLNIDGIPMILIVVQGGQGTLKTVYESLLQNVPILILAESKGCADLISNACLPESKDKFSQLIEESQIIERFRKNPILYEENMNLSLKWLQYIVEQKHKNLINVFKLENEEENQDIEISILKAFINSNPKKYFENFKFALKWDRFDIANMFIFTGEEEFRFIELSYLLELALVENKPKFVEYILENGLNLKSFLTINRLKFLYNSQKMKAVAKKSPFFRLLRKYHNNRHDGLARFSDLRHFLQNYLFDDFEAEFLQFHQACVIEDIRDEDENANEFDEENIDLTLEEIEKKRDGKKFNYPEKNLFVWALLMNRIEIAKIFWRIGEHQICTALFGYLLLKSMSRRLNDMRNELMENANEFEEMAYNVLNSIDSVTLDVINNVVLLRRIPYYNRTCLEMAVEAESLKFISLQAVQNLLNEIWIGNIEIERGFIGRLKYFLSCLSYGILAPFLIKNKPSLSTMLELVDEIGQEKIAKTLKYSGGSRKNKFGSNEDKNNDQTSEFNYIERYKHFISSPKICFLYETIFFNVFLILFSYMLLCEFEFEVKEESFEITNPHNDSYIQNRTNSSRFLNDHQDDYMRNFPKFIEFFLLFWIFTYIIDELRQMVFTKSRRKLSVRVWAYFATLWNLLDTFGSLLFISGFTLRLIACFKDNEELFVIARIVYAIDLSIWYLRLLHVSMVLKALGPKLIMIRKMLYDLSFFIVIVLIFVILFGVTTQATMYPGNKLDLDLFKNLINKAYWPIYGDIRLLDEINFDDKNCSLGNPSCPNAMGAYYSLFLLIFYMVIANVLLLNLLIAMFSFRFNNVQENTDLIWKFQMYELIDEYKDSYAFPPPISCISYLIFAITYFLTKKSSPLSDFYLDPKSRSRTLEYALSLERQFAEEYFINKKIDEREIIESRLKSANEKLEILERRLNEIIKNKSI